jgi:hypothetical protein
MGDEIRWCRTTGLLSQHLRFSCGRHPTSDSRSLDFLRLVSGRLKAPVL